MAQVNLSETEKLVRWWFVQVQKQLASGEVSLEHVQLSMSGWEGYAKMGDTFSLRQEISSQFAGMELMA